MWYCMLQHIAKLGGGSIRGSQQCSVTGKFQLQAQNNDCLAKDVLRPVQMVQRARCSGMLLFGCILTSAGSAFAGKLRFAVHCDVSLPS